MNGVMYVVGGFFLGIIFSLIIVADNTDTVENLKLNLYKDEQSCIVAEIKPCAAIAVSHYAITER